VFKPDDFTHPEDRAALEKLHAIPLFPACVKAFMKFLPERQLHGLNMASKIRLGPKQLPKIFDHLPPACKTLSIPEPEFYLEMNPVPNAYTYGDQRVFVTATSGLIESLDEQEIYAVVAHECGHIACQHVLYRTMAMMLLEIGERIFGPLSLLSVPVQIGLLYWFRRSELSADRAAAVVMGGAVPVVNTIIRLAGGPKSITGDVDVELYMAQSRAYDKLMESGWDSLLQSLIAARQTHPFLSVRAREITRWCAEPEFAKLMQRAKAARGVGEGKKGARRKKPKKKAD
jgi:Zn-dependent protease with chaperone function